MLPKGIKGDRTLLIIKVVLLAIMPGQQALSRNNQGTRTYDHHKYNAFHVNLCVVIFMYLYGHTTFKHWRYIFNHVILSIL